MKSFLIIYLSLALYSGTLIFTGRAISDTFILGYLFGILFATSGLFFLAKMSK